MVDTQVLKKVGGAVLVETRTTPFANRLRAVVRQRRLFLNGPVNLSLAIQYSLYMNRPGHLRTRCQRSRIAVLMPASSVLYSCCCCGSCPCCCVRRAAILVQLSASWLVVYVTGGTLLVYFYLLPRRPGRVLAQLV